MPAATWPPAEGALRRPVHARGVSAANLPRLVHGRSSARGLGCSQWASACLPHAIRAGTMSAGMGRQQACMCAHCPSHNSVTLQCVGPHTCHAWRLTLSCAASAVVFSPPPPARLLPARTVVVQEDSHKLVGCPCCDLIKAVKCTWVLLLRSNSNSSLCRCGILNCSVAAGM